jgi:hypothetical protein
MKENLELERKDIRIDPELEVDDDNQKQINFMVDAFFDVDKKFNININDEEGTWLNIWGFYNPFDDELKIKCQISRDIDNDECFKYAPTAEESKLIKDMVAERIQRYHNETPQEFCQSVWDEGETEGPVMGGM